MYCVNCGVKLADSQMKCPLCGTVVYHPDIQRPQAEPMYPKNSMPSPQVNPRSAQIIATALFLLPMLITVQCDWRLSGSITWSGYVIGALAIAYCLFVLPNWFRRPNPVVFCTLNFAAAGLYLLYINHVTEGNWYWSFGLPVTAALGLICTVVTALLRYLRRGRFYILGGTLAAFGLFVLLIELLLCLTFDTMRFVGWSTYPMTVLLVLGLTLICLGRSHRAREKMERKFYL